MARFNLGKVLFGVALLFMGYTMLHEQHRIYDRYLNAFRKQIFPTTLGSDTILGTELTMDDLNVYIIKLNAYFFMLGGICIATGSE